MGLQGFHYEMPDGAESRPKTAFDIAKTETMYAGIQIINGGGETNLHAHNGADAIWMVMSGRVAFYDENGNKLELGKNDFALICSGVKYWFEVIGEETVEVFRISANDLRVESSRTDVTTRDAARAAGATPHVWAPEIPLIAGAPASA